MTAASLPIDRRLCVAPMMEWTDRHCRYFHRLLAPSALLYTEMVTTGAILHGDKERFLRFNPAEHPVAVQLGGNDPDDLAACARICEDFGYDEINLNVGCPSDRVQNGRFGACLMLTPEVVAAGVQAMQQAVDVPVTVKCRIGVDDHDSYEHLHRFIQTVAQAGCQVFVVHARKAILSGLSPKENREIPPLRYDVVRQLKSDFPKLTIVLNGGVRDIDQWQAHSEVFDGVMLGRAAYQTPYLLHQIECQLAGRETTSRLHFLRAMQPYIEAEIEQGGRLHHVARHMLGLFHGQPGGKLFRRFISEQGHAKSADATLLDQAAFKLQEMESRQIDYS